MGEVPYTLEVSSPGVDRPLTEPRHWRRAARRLVRVKVAGEGTVEGRVLTADHHGVTLDVNGTKRELGYDVVGAGKVQVEFGRLPDEGDGELGDDQLDDDDELNYGGLLHEADLGAGGDGH
jgi:ribosome maturation factor RimP